MDTYTHMVPLVESRTKFNKKFRRLMKSIANKKVKDLTEIQVTTDEGVKQEYVNNVKQKVQQVMEIMKNVKEQDEILLQQSKQSLREAKIRKALKNLEHYKILQEL